jgi:hypothetical protein
MISKNFFMFIDETGLDEESKILAISCIITSEPGILRSSLDNLRKKLMSEKRFKDIPSVKKLENKSFHYCEDHQDVRPKVLDLIATLPFEAYIYYRPKGNNFCPSDGFDWYDQLFGKLMYDRLCKHKNSTISIFFEQHGSSFKAREQELESIILRLISEIKLKNVIDFTAFPEVKSAGKEEQCLAVADYVAAIFKDCEYTVVKMQEAGNHENSTSWQTRHFSMLRPKIRVIHYYKTGEFFTRSNPFP